MNCEPSGSGAEQAETRVLMLYHREATNETCYHKTGVGAKPLNTIDLATSLLAAIRAQPPKKNTRKLLVGAGTIPEDSLGGIR